MCKICELANLKEGFSGEGPQRKKECKCAIGRHKSQAIFSPAVGQSAA